MVAKRILAVGLLVLAVAGPKFAMAQAYPAKPIRVLSNSATSSPGDVSLRLVAPKISASIGQPVVIELRTGGAGQVAALEKPTSGRSATAWGCEARVPDAAP